MPCLRHIARLRAPGFREWRCRADASGGIPCADIFHEVDEEVRREQFQKLWDRYGYVLIAAAVVLVRGVGGWRGYQWWQAKQAAEAGAAYDAATELVEQGKPTEAEAAFDKVAPTAPPAIACWRACARRRRGRAAMGCGSRGL